MKSPLVVLGLAFCILAASGCPSDKKPPAAQPSMAAANSLVGTEWVLKDLGGTPALSGVQATLAFPETGRVSGAASCNRFTGTVEIVGSSLKFGPLAATRMACADEAVNNQEAKYLRMLGDAERYESTETSLTLLLPGVEKPLRFARLTPPKP